MGQSSSRTQDPVQTKRVIVGVFERFPRGTHTTQSIEEWWSDIVGSDGYFGSRLDELTDCKVAQIELHRSSSPPEHEFILAHIHYTKVGIHQSRIIYIGCSSALDGDSSETLIVSIFLTRSAAMALHKSKYGLIATFRTFGRNDVLQLAAAARVVDKEYCRYNPRHQCQLVSRTLCLLLTHDRIYTISETTGSTYMWPWTLVAGAINGLVTVPQDKDDFREDFVLDGQFSFSSSPFVLRLVSRCEECVDKARSDFDCRVMRTFLEQLCVVLLLQREALLIF